MADFAEIFDKKNVFKLILGAGNQDIDSIKQLVEVYLQAGADIFDFSCDRQLVFEMKKIIGARAKVCVSIGLDDDIHVRKAKINENCISCLACLDSCSQKAIVFKDKVFVDEKKCIGCGVCAEVCKQSAIDFYFKNKNFQEHFFEIQDLDVDCIEIHTNGLNDNVLECFEFLKNNFNGDLGVCISGVKLSSQGKVNLVEEIKKIIYPKKLIVQADGASMQGFNNEGETTVLALRAAKDFGEISDIYIIPSGGTNAKTAFLAKEWGIKINGVAIGTYARKLVLEHPENPLLLAKKLVDSVVN